jgi:hypothetical protein
MKHEWPNGAGVQGAFGFAQSVRLLLLFRGAWLNFWSLATLRINEHKYIRQVVGWNESRRH